MWNAIHIFARIMADLVKNQWFQRITLHSIENRLSTCRKVTELLFSKKKTPCWKFFVGDTGVPAMLSFGACHAVYTFFTINALKIDSKYYVCRFIFLCYILRKIVGDTGVPAMLFNPGTWTFNVLILYMSRWSEYFFVFSLYTLSKNAFVSFYYFFLNFPYKSRISTETCVHFCRRYRSTSNVIIDACHAVGTFFSFNALKIDSKCDVCRFIIFCNYVFHSNTVSLSSLNSHSPDVTLTNFFTLFMQLIGNMKVTGVVLLLCKLLFPLFQ